MFSSYLNSELLTANSFRHSPEGDRYCRTVEQQACLTGITAKVVLPLLSRNRLPLAAKFSFFCMGMSAADSCVIDKVQIKLTSMRPGHLQYVLNPLHFSLVNGGQGAPPKFAGSPTLPSRNVSFLQNKYSFRIIFTEFIGHGVRVSGKSQCCFWNLSTVVMVKFRGC